MDKIYPHDFHITKEYKAVISPSRFVKIVLQDQADRKFIDVRFWVRYREGAEFSPTYRGITMTTKLWKEEIIPHLIDFSGL